MYACIVFILYNTYKMTFLCTPYTENKGMLHSQCIVKIFPHCNLRCTDKALANYRSANNRLIIGT